MAPTQTHAIGWTKVGQTKHGLMIWWPDFSSFITFSLMDFKTKHQSCERMGIQVLPNGVWEKLISWPPSAEGLTQANSQVTRAEDFLESAVVRWLLQLWRGGEGSNARDRKTVTLTFHRSNVYYILRTRENVEEKKTERDQEWRDRLKRWINCLKKRKKIKNMQNKTRYYR